jgi:creatinine amidohydrolase
MGSATSAEIAESRPLLLLPLGAWEQHGPHLPLDTDTIIVTRVIADVLRHEDLQSVNVMTAPALSITASDEHQGFPGTLSTGTQALKDSVVAICRSASWAQGVCIVNGHGGNSDALAEIASALTYEKITHSIWSLPSYIGGDMHAGHTETSLLLHIAPHEVRTNVIAPGAAQDAGLVEAMRTSGVQAVSKNGIIGDASTATVSHGKAVLDLYTSSLRAHVLACHQEWTNDR